MRLLLAVVLVLAAIVRLSRPWRVPAVSVATRPQRWRRQSGGTWRSVISATASDTYPPGYNILVYLSFQLFGVSEWSLRLPAALLGLFTVAAVYWTARPAGGRVTALLAAVMIAVSAFPVAYSQEGRMYALMGLAVTLFAGSTIRLLSRDKLRDAVFAALSGVALLYSHPYGLLCWVSISAAASAVLLVHRRSALLPFIIVQAVIALGFLPWAAISIGRATSIMENGFWIGRPTVSSVYYALTSIASGVVGLVILIAGAVIALVMIRRRPQRPDEGLIPFAVSIPVLLAWTLAPLFMGIVISLAATPIFLPRYVYCVLPGLMILAALGYGRFIQRWPTTIGVSAAFLLLFGSTLWTGGLSHGEDWRGAAAFLKAEMQAGDCVLASSGGVRVAVRFYLPDLPDCMLVPRDIGDMEAKIAAASQVFVIRSHSRTNIAKLQEALPGGPWRQGDVIRFGSGIQLAKVTRQPD